MADPVIYLDMDGVLVQFVEGVLRLFERPELLATWPKGEYRMSRVMGVPRAAMWAGIDAGGAAWWANLEPYPWTRTLAEQLGEVAEVVIVSDPSGRGSAVAGKLHWLDVHLPQLAGDYLFGPRKELLARPGALLIDDCAAHVARFINAGGRAVLFPQPWNPAVAEMNGGETSPEAAVLCRVARLLRQSDTD